MFFNKIETLWSRIVLLSAASCRGSFISLTVGASVNLVLFVRAGITSLALQRLLQRDHGPFVTKRHRRKNTRRTCVKHIDEFLLQNRMNTSIEQQKRETVIPFLARIDRFN